MEVFVSAGCVDGPPSCPEDEEGLDALESAISSIGHWRKTCRGKASSTLKAEQAVQDTIKRLATAIVDSSEALVNLDFLVKLE
eukprot:19269-Pyramimonas_sp.AAC.1